MEAERANEPAYETPRFHQNDPANDQAHHANTLKRSRNAGTDEIDDHLQPVEWLRAGVRMFAQAKGKRERDRESVEFIELIELIGLIGLIDLIAQIELIEPIGLIELIDLIAASCALGARSRR